MSSELLMPRLGVASDEQTLLAWSVKEGDRVEVGQPVFDVETDKAVMSVEATEAGRIGKILVPEGTAITAGTPVAILLAEGEAFSAAPEPATEPAHVPVDTQRPDHAVSSPDETGTHPPRSSPAGVLNERRNRASPRARAAAKELGVDIQGIDGTGPRGRVLESDVRRAAEAQPLPSAVGGLEDAPVPQPMSSIRATIARRMAASAAETAAVTLTREVIADALVSKRQALRAQLGKPVPFDVLLAVLCARALKSHPSVNASLNGSAIQMHQAVHIGIAVDTDRGLLAPVLRDVDRRDLPTLLDEWQALFRRTQSGSAGPDELAGATFTLTNLGPFGIDAFTPIINLPNAAILGVGRILSRPAVVNGSISVVQAMVLSLTFDHRLVDGAPAARFLGHLADLIEHPEL
jgi:pyruvate dehydrogenase E2 component (dihydrolipoamide acetyltransferase)